jgi:hypothetical protein
MDVLDVEKTLEEVSQINDIGKRLLYWRDFEKQFEQLNEQEKTILRQKVENKARLLIKQTDELLNQIRN